MSSETSWSPRHSPTIPHAGEWTVTQLADNARWGPTNGPADVLHAARRLALINQTNLLKTWAPDDYQTDLPYDRQRLLDVFVREPVGNGERWYLSSLVKDLIVGLADDLPAEATWTELVGNLPATGLLWFQDPVLDPVTANADHPTFDCGVAWWHGQFTARITENDEDTGTSEQITGLWTWPIITAALGAPKAEQFLSSPITPLAPSLTVTSLATPDGHKTPRPNDTDPASHAPSFYPRLLAAMSLWSQSMLTPDNTEPRNNQERKNIKRAARKETESGRPGNVTIYRLRRLAPPDEKPEPTGRTANYSHRFIVGPFPRWQRHGPGLTERKLIQVGPFIKGPDHLPLRLKDGRIVTFDR